MSRPPTPSATQPLTRRPSLRDLLRYAKHVLLSRRRVTVARASMDGVYVAWTLKARGFRPLLRAASGGRRRADAGVARDVAGAVDVGIAATPFAPTCFLRSVTLLRELNRLGLAGDLHIGVRNAPGTIEAHAWIEVEGVVINDVPATTDTYTPMATGDLESLQLLIR